MYLSKVFGATSRMTFREVFVVNRDLTFHSAIFRPVNVTHFIMHPDMVKYRAFLHNGFHLRRMENYVP